MRKVTSTCGLVLLVLVVFTCASVSAATLTAKRSGSAIDVLTFAREVDGPYTMPTDVLTVEYVPSVIRSADKDFFLTLTFSDGAKFATGTPIPKIQYVGTGSVTIALLTATPLDGKTSIEWHVVVNTAATTFPTFIIHFDNQVGAGGSGVKIDAGTTIEAGGSVSAQVTVRDANTGDPFDTPAQDTLFRGAYAIFVGNVFPDNATIDVAIGRTGFVDEPDLFPVNPVDDNPNRDAGAEFTVVWDQNIYAADGTFFANDAAPDKMFANQTTQQLKVTYASNLAEISVIRLSEGEARELSRSLTDAERAGLSVSVEGNWAQLAMLNRAQIYIQKDGDIVLSRDLTISVELLAGGVVDNGHVLITNELLTSWRPNGTVLMMPWANGNNAVMNGRVYLYNETSVTGPITARVLTLPRIGTPSAELGSVVVGTLPANGTAMIKVAEDILAPLPATLPYLADGGNLMIEFTVQVMKVSGAFQVFNAGFAYGTTLLQVVEPPAPEVLDEE